MPLNTAQEAAAAFQAHLASHVANGIIPLDSVRSYITPAMKKDWRLAMDAQPTAQLSPNSGIPAYLVNLMDPEVFKILLAPNKGAEIIGEEKRGDWTMQTMMFPTAEQTGETTAYGDYDENGMAGVNMNFPNRESFRYQIVKQYGELEIEMAGLAKINLVSEIDGAAATSMGKFLNFTYFFGVYSLECYGLLNDPNLSAALTPAPKIAGGNGWVQNGVVVATANEIFTDIQSMFIKLVAQTQSLVDNETKMVLALSPQSKAAFTATNAFNVNVNALLKDNFPNLEVKTAPQYGAVTASNPQGLAGGNLAQLIAPTVEGQKSGYCSFAEKSRSHKIIPAMTSYRQKVSGSTWGAIIRQPFAFAQMQGI